VTLLTPEETTCEVLSSKKEISATDPIVIIYIHPNSIPGVCFKINICEIVTGVQFPARAGILSLRHRVQIGSEAHTASCPVGTRGLSPRVKRPGREADHSPQSSAEVKNSRSCTFTLQYASILWRLVKRRIRLHGVVLN